MSWRIPDEVRRQIAAEPSFLGRRELADKYRVSETVIRAVRKEFGVPANPRGYPPGLSIPRALRRGRRGIPWPLKAFKKQPLDWTL